MILANETVARGLDSFKLIFNGPDNLFTVFVSLRTAQFCF